MSTFNKQISFKTRSLFQFQFRLITNWRIHLSKFILVRESQATIWYSKIYNFFWSTFNSRRWRGRNGRFDIHLTFQRRSVRIKSFRSISFCHFNSLFLFRNDRQLVLPTIPYFSGQIHTASNHNWGTWVKV